MPGTFGTLSALLVYVCLVYLLDISFADEQYIICTLCLYSVIVGTYLSNKILEFEKDKEENKNVKDPQFIVIDEWAGYYITILFSTSLFEVCVGFLFFRLFDILKPWIISKAEQLPRGYGIMADDIAAGVFSLACML
ncbi:MAG: phosphatidylglycerophosphatase A, partial [Bdellovibrionota bacterium]